MYWFSKWSKWSYRCKQTFLEKRTAFLSRYGLGGPGIESKWRRDFQHPSAPGLGHTQPHVKWVAYLFPGGKATGGVALTIHPI